MAVKFPFVSAFLCENVLQEGNGVLSAIRIVDVFQIPEGAPENFVIRFYAVAMLRTVPVPDIKVSVTAAIVRTNGERQPLPMVPGEPIQVGASSDRTIPGGINLIMELNIKPQNMGTGYIEFEVDGEVAVSIPFTLRPAPPTSPEQ
jgi:hypothetical protein